MLICTIHCPQLLRSNLFTTCKNKLSAKSACHFEKLFLIKCLVIHGLHARPMFFPYYSSPLISPVSVHMLSKQGNAHLTLWVTLCHLLSRSHATNINYPALTTISSIIIWLVPTTLPLSLRRSHASAFKLKLEQYLFTTLWISLNSRYPLSPST